MLQNYELYMILHPELSSDEVDTHIASLESVLSTEVVAQNISIDKQGLKKLAYPIAKHTSGFYCLITFESELKDIRNMINVERKINLDESIVRFIIVNQTDYIVQKSKEELNKVEVTSLRELNKSKAVAKRCISRHLGLREVDYKDTEYLNQFTSPYAKIFSREKTGSSSKFQRKISKAIKRARHMALMPFTPLHNL
jgi:small subunit ribosomal protein S18